ncbi:MAG: hypothetical protein ACTH6Y_05020 [Vibrio hibernica]
MKYNDSIITVLLSVGVILSVCHLILNLPLIYGGIFIAASLLFTLSNLSVIVKFQVYSLITIGIGSLLFAAYHHQPVQWAKAITLNSPLICIVLGASMLKLICLPSQQRKQASGTKGIWQTLVSTHLFSSVINISAMYLAADFFQRTIRVSHAHAAILSRAYTLSMLWSPMMAGMAIALTWSPDASIGYLFIMGVPMAMLCLIFTAREATTLEGGEYQSFQGVSMGLNDLKVPGSLTLCILLINYWFQIDSIPLLVAGMSIFFVFFMMSIKYPKQGLRRIGQYALTQLPAMKNEVALFIAAGVFAQGLSSLFVIFIPGQLELTINWVGCSLIVIIIISLAYIGLHPIASIAIIGSYLHNASFSPNMLALSFLTAWSFGSLASPFSGTTMAFTQRYHISIKSLRKNNQTYLLVSIIYSIFALYISEKLIVLK